MRFNSSCFRGSVMLLCGISPAFCSRKTHLSRQCSAPLADIDQREHRVSAIGVLGQPAVAHLGEAPQALERQKRMLHQGANRGLAPIGLLVRFGERAMLVPTLVGEVFSFGSDGFEPLTLLLAPIGAVAVEA